MSNANTPAMMAHSMAESLLRENKALKEKNAQLVSDRDDWKIEAENRQAMYRASLELNGSLLNVYRQNMQLVSELQEQNALLTVQKEEVMRAWADALIEEINAISCRYHGDPSYDHDAYWMKGAVKDLIGKMMKWPPIPVKDRYIPDSECSQGKCANPTTGCFGKCYIAQHPEWPNVSLPPAHPQQVKSA